MKFIIKANKMKKIIALLLVVGLGFSFQSCQDEPKKDKKEKVSSSETAELQKKFNELMKESVQAHDEVMPKMGSINEHISKLESLNAEKENGEIEAAMEELKKGHDMMMSWMKSFGNDFSKEEINQGTKEEDPELLKSKIELVESHHQSAQEMKKQINSSLARAKELLDEEV